MPLKKPEAVLIDLDDTLVASCTHRIEYWNRVTEKYEERVAPVTPKELSLTIINCGDWFWGSNGRNMKWRLYLREARQKIVETAFEKLELTDMELAHSIANDFSDLRENGENINTMVPGSIETIKQIKERGIKIALLTNGGTRSQRNKIEHFNLEPFLDQILIEEELGFGKPDLRIYHEALKRLEVKKEDAWMIGDNPLWDVITPQKLGIKGIWINRKNWSEPGKFCPFLSLDSFPDIMKYLK